MNPAGFADMIAWRGGSFAAYSAGRTDGRGGFVWTDGGSGRIRVALVIGNSTHQNVSALPNPVNDANDISDS